MASRPRPEGKQLGAGGSPGSWGRRPGSAAAGRAPSPAPSLRPRDRRKGPDLSGRGVPAAKRGSWRPGCVSPSEGEDRLAGRSRAASHPACGGSGCTDGAVAGPSQPRRSPATPVWRIRPVIRRCAPADGAAGKVNGPPQGQGSLSAGQDGAKSAPCPGPTSPR